MVSLTYFKFVSLDVTLDAAETVTMILLDGHSDNCFIMSSILNVPTLL